MLCLELPAQPAGVRAGATTRLRGKRAPLTGTLYMEPIIQKGKEVSREFSNSSYVAKENRQGRSL